LSYFPKFHCLRGGVATGFHHVTEPPEPNPRLFAIKSHPDHSNHSLVYELPVEATSLRSAVVFVLDKGNDIWQFNRKGSPGKQRFQAAEFVRTLADARKGQGDVQVYDEGGHGAGVFLSGFGVELLEPIEEREKEAKSVTLWKIVDGGFSKVSDNPRRSDLESMGIFIVDCLDRSGTPILYVWIGSQTPGEERKRAIQVGQEYLNQHRENQRRTCVVRVNEGGEGAAFLDALCI